MLIIQKIEFEWTILKINFHRPSFKKYFRMLLSFHSNIFFLEIKKKFVKIFVHLLKASSFSSVSSLFLHSFSYAHGCFNALWWLYILPLEGRYDAKFIVKVFRKFLVEWTLVHQASKPKASFDLRPVLSVLDTIIYWTDFLQVAKFSRYDFYGKIVPKIPINHQFSNLS